MKQKIILLLIVLVMGIFLTERVKALEYTATTKGYLKEYIKKEKEGIATRYQQLEFMGVNGEDGIVYCLEPFAIIDRNMNYMSNLSKNNLQVRLNITLEQQQRVEAYNYYGYMYPGHEEEKWYAITQLRIWQTVDPSLNVYFTNTLNGQKINKYEQEFRELDNLVAQSLQEASFNNKTYKVNLGESLEIDSENFKVADYSIVKNGDHKFIISGAYPIDREYTAHKISPDKNRLYMPMTGTSQKLFSGNSIQAYTQKFRVIVTAGQITINFKKDDNLNSCNDEIQDVYGLYDENNNLIKEIKVEKNYTYISDYLKYGKYYLKQISHSCNIKENPNIIEIDINSTNEHPTIDVILEEDLKKLIIDKKYLLENNYFSEEKATFAIENDTNKYEVTTDETGIASVLIKRGVYEIRQISGRENYLFIEKTTINTDDYNDTIKLNFVNKPIKRNISVLVKADDIMLTNAKVCLYNDENILIKCAQSDAKGKIEFAENLLGNYYIKAYPYTDFGIEKDIIQFSLANEDVDLIINYHKIIQENKEEIIDDKKEEIPTENSEETEKETEIIEIPNTKVDDYSYIFKIICLLAILKLRLMC